MSFDFEPSRGLIIVPTELTGPIGSAVVCLPLDTGATTTLVNVNLLVAVGCEPALATEQVEVTTGSGMEFPPRVTLSKVAALGQTRLAFSVLALTLLPTADIDGLLGLDFFRGQVLSIDFRNGQLVVS